jgi:hypothetical protein
MPGKKAGANKPPLPRPQRRNETMLSILISMILTIASGQVFRAQQPTKADIDKLCNAEKVEPNLVLRQSTHVNGRITDIEGVPLKKSQVGLRRYISKEKQVRLKTVTTDDNGNFDLGAVEKGEYRLLASPNRIFQQPPRVECPEKNCQLNIALQINATDQPESACPIR